MKTFLILLLSLMTASVFSQDLTYFMMRPDMHSFATRPQHVPEKDYYLAIPVLGNFKFNYFNSGFTYRQLFTKRSDDSLYLDMDKALSKMKTNNFLGFTAEMQLLGFGFRKDDYFFSFSVTEKFNTGFFYPKDFINLLDKGNAPYIGETLTFDNLALDAQHYREYALGFSQQVNEELSIGFRVKYINGMMNISTDNKNIEFTTDADDYSLHLNTDVVVNTSAHFISDENGTPSAGNYLFGQNNHGAGLDAGITYKKNESTTFSLSVLDMGWIRWNDNLRNYRTSSGSYTFSGIDIRQFVDDTTRNVGSVIDSLEATYNAEEFRESYTTGLHTQLFAGVTRKLNSNTEVGGLVHLYFFKGIILPSVTLSAAKQLSETVDLTATYSYTNKNFENIGLGFSVNSGSVSFFTVSDNLLGLFWPKSFHSTGIRAGLAFCWDKNEGN